MTGTKKEREDWEEIHGFATPGEYKRFCQWLDEAINEDALVEIEVKEPYDGSKLWDERWFQASSGNRWRIIAPNFPFRGIFLKVKS